MPLEKHAYCTTKINLTYCLYRVSKIPRLRKFLKQNLEIIQNVSTISTLYVHNFAAFPTDLLSESWTCELG